MLPFFYSVYNNMKGGGDIKKVILIFVGTGIYDKYQACVNIYDTCGNLLYNKTTYNRKLVLYLKENTVYKLVATSYGEIIKTFFIVSKYNDIYKFYFNRGKYNKNVLRTITFFLADANYNNLPIEKGEIFLWQKQ